MVAVMPHLTVVQVTQGIAHGPGGVGGEVAFGRIKQAGSVSEGLLCRQLDLGMGQPQDVVELPGDSRREGKELFHPFFHDGKNLAGCLTARQARECG